ncbi:MAG: DegT/DnrJ/EryC1/StrS family aminotransferase [Crocinitomicaceae bacterium]|nr:DegT/DnrJ/EryC1/StrS family aminotransferase [Crocinitomicaceae bacterium]
MKLIPFSPPRIDELTIAAVTDVLRSGWITTGPRTREFERRIAAYTGSKKVLCLNSWTNAAELVLRWFGVGQGDEVIVPAYTYAATANIVVHLGARPVMVDCTPGEFVVSADAIEAAITKRTKAIMPVDIGGWPCDYDAIMEVVQRSIKKRGFEAAGEPQNKLGRPLVLNDAAHSFGARYKGKSAGVQTDVAGFSFHAVKNLTTAEGGAVILNLPEPFDNESIWQSLNISALHGQTKDALSKNQPGQWRYDIIEAGYKCNMTDIQAAIGLVELDRYDNDTLLRRKKICTLYSKFFSNFDWAISPVFSDATRVSSYHLFLLRIKNATEAQRDAIIVAAAEEGISLNVHFQPLPMLSFYKGMGYRIADFPNALAQYSNEISLPVYYDLSDEDAKFVVDTISTAVKRIMR